MGREVCQRAGGKALLGGTIAMLGSAYVVTLNAQDCVDGNVIAEEQVQASSKETVLAALGAAVSVFREKLGESLGSIQRYDAKIEEATTPSLEALKAYSQGLRTRRTTGDFDSVPFFRRAIELDPEFGLAYARLGTVYSNLGQADEARKMTAKAYEFRAKVSEVERYYIEARYFTTVEPDVQKALDVYRVWLAAYPNDYTALANSALLLKQRGEMAEALRNQEAAVRVAPDQPIAWGNLGDTYMSQGDYAQAREAFETALKLQNAVGPRASLYALGIITGDLALADEQAAALVGQRDEIELHVGAHAGRGVPRPDEGSQRPCRRLAGAHGGGQPARADGTGADAGGHQRGARRHGRCGPRARQRPGRRRVARRRTPSTTGWSWPPFCAMPPWRAGSSRSPSSRPARRARQHASRPISSGSSGRLGLMGEGRPAEAAALFEPVTFEPSKGEIVAMWTVAQVQAKNWEPALKGLNLLAADTWQRGLGTAKAFAMVEIARAHAALGRRDEARKSYQAFFEFWKNADPDVPLLLQAREEFSSSALKAGTAGTGGWLQPDLNESSSAPSVLQESASRISDPPSSS